MTIEQEYSPTLQWTNAFAKHGMAYPAEYVIRIFRGNYPRLAMPKPVVGQAILDVGCGDGRHLPFFASLGLKPHGVEIAELLVKKLRENLAPWGIAHDQLHVGSCASLPLENSMFDYVMAWNSSYYMSLNGTDFSAHADELVRVLRPGGWLLLSVPKMSAFIFEGSEPTMDEGYRVIRKDPFGVRVGEIMRVFQSGEELASIFEKHCDNFCHASIHDDCFGLAYHWHLLVAQKKG